MANPKDVSNPTNPVDNFLGEQQKNIAQKRQRELDALNQWKKTNNPAHLQSLVDMYAPVINYGMRQYKAPSIPEAAMRAELTKHVVNAFNSYDPSKGTLLNTHVQNHIRKASRYNTRHQNVGYIPEGQKALIAPIQQAKDELFETYGRDPTHQEIADHVGVAPKMVQRVQKALRKDISASAFENDPSRRQISMDAEIISLLPHSLSEKERPVFDYLYGDRKEEHTGSKGALAKKLGLNASQLSRINTSIIKKYESYKK